MIFFFFFADHDHYLIPSFQKKRNCLKISLFNGFKCQVVFLSPPVHIHVVLVYIAFCLSVWSGLDWTKIQTRQKKSPNERLLGMTSKVLLNSQK